jgi:hypothetical protein
MQNIGQEEFDYGTFKLTYDSDPVVQALTKRFDQNGIELNSKKTKADVTQQGADDAGATVSQMAKRATNSAQK